MRFGCDSSIPDRCSKLSKTVLDVCKLRLLVSTAAVEVLSPSFVIFLCILKLERYTRDLLSALACSARFCGFFLALPASPLLV